MEVYDKETEEALDEDRKVQQAEAKLEKLDDEVWKLKERLQGAKPDSSEEKRLKAALKKASDKLRDAKHDYMAARDKAAAKFNKKRAEELERDRRKLENRKRHTRNQDKKDRIDAEIAGLTSQLAGVQGQVLRALWGAAKRPVVPGESALRRVPKELQTDPDLRKTLEEIRELQAAWLKATADAEAHAVGSPARSRAARAATNARHAIGQLTAGLEAAKKSAAGRLSDRNRQKARERLEAMKKRKRDLQHEKSITWNRSHRGDMELEIEDLEEAIDELGRLIRLSEQVAQHGRTDAPPKVVRIQVGGVEVEVPATATPATPEEKDKVKKATREAARAAIEQLGSALDPRRSYSLEELREMLRKKIRSYPEPTKSLNPQRDRQKISEAVDAIEEIDAVLVGLLGRTTTDTTPYAPGQLDYLDRERKKPKREAEEWEGFGPPERRGGGPPAEPRLDCGDGEMKSWSALTEGLPAKAAWQLAVTPTSVYLYDGGNVWTFSPESSQTIRDWFAAQEGSADPKANLLTREEEIDELWLQCTHSGVADFGILSDAAMLLRAAVTGALPPTLARAIQGYGAQIRDFVSDAGTMLAEAASVIAEFVIGEAKIKILGKLISGEPISDQEWVELAVEIVGDLVFAGAGRVGARLLKHAFKPGAKAAGAFEKRVLSQARQTPGRKPLDAQDLADIRKRVQRGLTTAAERADGLENQVKRKISRTGRTQTAAAAAVPGKAGQEAAERARRRAQAALGEGSGAPGGGANLPGPGHAQGTPKPSVPHGENMPGAGPVRTGGQSTSGTPGAGSAPPGSGQTQPRGSGGQPKSKRAPKRPKVPVRKNEVATYEDFVKRSVVGDNLEGHEVWQHANQKSLGLATRRLQTPAAKKNPVIVLEHEVHKKVNAAQRALDAASQTPIENIQANIKILRDLRVAPDSVLDELQAMALQHARSLGY